MNRRWPLIAELHELTTRNYEFALLGQERVDGHDCYVLQLTPKRNDPELVNGKAWVDAANFQIRRIEGTPAKSPSWWIHNLHVTINYGAVQGIWTQLATKAVADVRLLGTHVLTSREVDLQTSTVDARNQPPNRAGHSAAAEHLDRLWPTALCGYRARRTSKSQFAARSSQRPESPRLLPNPD